MSPDFLRAMRLTRGGSSGWFGLKVNGSGSLSSNSGPGASGGVAQHPHLSSYGRFSIRCLILSLGFFFFLFLLSTLEWQKGDSRSSAVLPISSLNSDGGALHALLDEDVDPKHADTLKRGEAVQTVDAEFLSVKRIARRPIELWEASPRRISRNYLKGQKLRRVNGCSETDPCYFLVVADLDKLSKVKDDKGTTLHYQSYMLAGRLFKKPYSDGYEVQWDTQGSQELRGKHNEAGRGLELSELALYQDKLLTFDDRSGIIFEFLPNATKPRALVPRYLALEGDGNTSKGMKIEWATEKDGRLWLGSFGKEFTDPQGLTITSENNNWVAIMDEYGVYEYKNWKEIYDKLRLHLGAPFPGYLLHEAVLWSPLLKLWIFLPRRISREPYNEKLDEKRGSNKMILATENFSKLTTIEVGKIIPERGFSSCKFVPGTHDNIIAALKSSEHELSGHQETFLTVFTLTGKVLLNETRLPHYGKFEGLEFVPKSFIKSQSFSTALNTDKLPAKASFSRSGSF